MKKLAAGVLLVACGAPMAMPDAGADGGALVRRVTITSDVFADPGPGARLSDGTVVAAGMGDLWLAQRSTVSVYASPPLGICDVGVYASLDAVPTDASACAGAPADSIVLAANTNGTNQWVGRAWLVFAHTTDTAPVYRARVVSDMDGNPSITLTFEYQPL